MNIISIIFYILLADAVTAAYLAFTGKLTFLRTAMPSLARFLPHARRWSLVYLALVFILGGILAQLGLLIMFW